ncbi:hypothetical protein GCM10010052_38850 [Paenarthrobacter histidinolovorans]|nr:hypothetical protein GCM10010052_38850 [Paenarthrobacter histidinolovorans]
MALGAGSALAAGGGAAGTATEGTPGIGVTAVAGAEATGGVLGAAGGGVGTETVGSGLLVGDVAASGAAVQPAAHSTKPRQAAVIAVVLLVPRPACMTAPRSCPSTCTSNVRTGSRGA